jgi:hypothetical protein
VRSSPRHTSADVFGHTFWAHERRIAKRGPLESVVQVAVLNGGERGIRTLRKRVRNLLMARDFWRQQHWGQSVAGPLPFAAVTSSPLECTRVVETSFWRRSGRDLTRTGRMSRPPGRCRTRCRATTSRISRGHSQPALIARTQAVEPWFLAGDVNRQIAAVEVSQFDGRHGVRPLLHQEQKPVPRNGPASPACARCPVFTVGRRAGYSTALAAAERCDSGQGPQRGP